MGQVHQLDQPAYYIIANKRQNETKCPRNRNM